MCASAATVHKPERARTEDGHGVAGVDLGGDRGVHRARGGLDHHGVVVGQGVGHPMELRLVGHEPARRPTPAGVGAEPDLQARRQVAEGDTLAPAGAAFGARRAGRDDAARHAPEDGLDHDPGVGVVERSRRTSWPGTKGKLTTSSK